MPITTQARTQMTEQGILNHSVDPQFGIVAIEILGYDPANDVLRRIPVDENGVIKLGGITGVYYVSDTSGGAVTRKLTFTNGILTSDT